MHTSSSVLLLSGGLDSAVCLALERPEAALFVDYGQPHLASEQPRAERLASDADLSLYVARVSVPGWVVDPADATMLVPGRNLILVSLAAALAERVVIGCNADDYDDYWDCRPEFFLALLDVVEVTTPLVDLTKEQIGTLARDLGVGETWSCYYPRAGRPCGECGACQGRMRALG